MNPHDWHLSLLLRLDRIKAAVNALKSFHASRTEAQARDALSKANRILSRPTP